MQVGICHFVLTTGGRVVHSYGRLIPHEFPITDLQQISGPDGIGRITCTVSNETARLNANSGNKFNANGGQLETGGVSQTRIGFTATLVVNMSNIDRFQNKGLHCTIFNANLFYLFISKNASKFASMNCKNMSCAWFYTSPVRPITFTSEAHDIEIFAKYTCLTH